MMRERERRCSIEHRHPSNSKKKQRRGPLYLLFFTSTLADATRWMTALISRGGIG